MEESHFVPGEREGRSLNMSSFAQRQAALVAQVLGSLDGEPPNSLHLGHPFCPCNLHRENQFQTQFPITATNITDSWCQKCSYSNELPVFDHLFYQEHKGFNEQEYHAPLIFSDLCCTEPPADSPCKGSFYTLDDVLKNLPKQHFEVEKHLQLPQLQSYRKPHVSVEPQSVAARHRRTKIREKIRSLEKLIPLGSKLDMAKMLEEAIKYVKFLRAQVQVLECMPHVDSRSDLKSNPTTADDSLNLCNGGGWSVWLTNDLALQKSASASLMKQLSAQQMLYSLLASSTIQRKLFSAGNVIATVQQKEMVSPDFSIFS